MGKVHRVPTPRNGIMVIPRQVPDYLVLIDCIYEYADAYTSSYVLPAHRLVYKAWLDVMESLDTSFKLWPDAAEAIAARILDDKRIGFGAD